MRALMTILQNNKYSFFSVRHEDTNKYFEFEDEIETDKVTHNKIRLFEFEKILKDIEKSIQLLNNVKVIIEKEMFDRIG
jgi:hypothetical protein